MLVNSDDSQSRIDTYLQRKYPDYSRSYLTKLIQQNQILVNGHNVRANYKVKSDDKIEVLIELGKNIQPAAINIPIIYEDDFCLVLNKPAGIITHAKGSLNNEPSVASFISDKVALDMTGNRAGIVHRLDRGTSGVIITAKTDFALKYLQRQFAKRQTRKTYLAIVQSGLEHKQALINMPIERNPKKPSTFRIGANGKPSQTEFLELASNDNYSLLELTPLTGRTHQLRVHLKAVHHPIVGDALYGGLPAKRLMLHAYKLEVILPDIGRKSFTAPPPQVFQKYVKYDLVK